MVDYLIESGEPWQQRNEQEVGRKEKKGKKRPTKAAGKRRRSRPQREEREKAADEGSREERKKTAAESRKGKSGRQCIL